MVTNPCRPIMPTASPSNQADREHKGDVHASFGCLDDEIRMLEEQVRTLVCRLEVVRVIAPQKDEPAQALPPLSQIGQGLIHQALRIKSLRAVVNTLLDEVQV